MEIFYSALALISGIFFSGLLHAEHQKNRTEYSFGVVPQFSVTKTVKTWNPILRRLEQETGFAFHLRTLNRIPQFEKGFISGAYDFAYMNPYHSLIAFEEQGYKPVIRDGGRMLFGVLVVHKDSQYQAVEELRNKQIAFPAPNALGASLLIRSDFEQKYGMTYLPSYVQTHSSVYLNVALKQTEAGGGVMSTYMGQPEAIKGNLRVIYETTKLHPHPVAAHPRIPKGDVERLQKAFLKIAETEEGRELLQKVPMLQPVIAHVDDYLGIKDLKLEKYLQGM